jgi:hypothetical protein
MPKFAGNLAYIEGQQCNDPAAPAMVRTSLERSRYWPTAHGDADATLIDAGSAGAPNDWGGSDRVAPPTPRSGSLLRQAMDALLAIAIFAAQVAGVIFMIVLLAKYSIR